MAPMEKGKISFASLFKVFSFGKTYLPLVIISVVFSAVQAVVFIIAPRQIGDVTNAVAAGIMSPNGVEMESLLGSIYFMIALYSSGFVAMYVANIAATEATHRLSRKLRTAINDKINVLPLSYFDTTTVGDILSRVTNDVDTISQTLGSALSTLINSLVMFVGVTIMMFVVNYILAFVTIGSSIIGFVGVSIILRISQSYFKKRQANLGDMNGNIEEIYSNQKIVKAFGAEEYAREEFLKINSELRHNNRKSQFFSGMMQPLMGFAGNLSYALIFLVGVALAINSEGTAFFGTIISFTLYARLFSQPLSSFAQSMSSLQMASAASDRVFALLSQNELEDESGKSLEVKDIEGAVDFDHVTFSYDERRIIIKDFSASIKPGMKVAIVGPTGAGKTTMVNLLMRFYEVGGGDIRIDGVSIREYRREQIHDMFDMILQDTWLFSGTVRENLCFNKTGVTDEELQTVCKAVGLDYFIGALPNGYDTVLDDSSSLSEGQKQQLTIARAMIKGSKMLILDEATSSVDTRTEVKIQEAMDMLMKGRTSFVIAHRLSTIRNADLILVMRDGDIVEQGNHNELIAKNGFYAELYNTQFDPVS